MFSSGEAEEKGWIPAKLHRKFIRDEGLLNPADWVFIFFIPKGVRFRVVVRNKEDEKWISEIGGSPLRHDEGKRFEGKTMIQFQIGGRVRLKSSLLGRAMDFEKIEKRFWVEWNATPDNPKVPVIRPDSSSE